MALEYKDYYQVLGLSREASPEEIRNAFRRLARRYHPDVAKDKKAAEEKFKEINEAYEVLSDPDKRRQYDELGSQWRSGSPFSPPAGGGEAGDYEFQFGGTGFSDFFEQIFGARARRQSNRGFAEDLAGSPARGRDVEADLMVPLEEALNGALRPISLRLRMACESCGGSGRERRGSCRTCRGTGQVTRSEQYQLKIPAGVREGQRLRLAGRGQAGSAGGPAGDLYLRVRLARHPDFRVVGSDLYYELELAAWEAVLGAAEVRIPALDGPVAIRIPAGAHGGQQLRVRGRGLGVAGGGRGDLYVELVIQVPKTVGERERRLWEELARTSGYRPRE